MRGAGGVTAQSHLPPAPSSRAQPPLAKTNQSQWVIHSSREGKSPPCKGALPRRRSTLNLWGVKAGSDRLKSSTDSELWVEAGSLLDPYCCLLPHQLTIGLVPTDWAPTYWEGSNLILNLHYHPETFLLGLFLNIAFLPLGTRQRIHSLECCSFTWQVFKMLHFCRLMVYVPPRAQSRLVI